MTVSTFTAMRLLTLCTPSDHFNLPMAGLSYKQSSGDNATLYVSSSPVALKVRFAGWTVMDTHVGAVYLTVYVPGEPTFLTLRFNVTGAVREGTLNDG